MYVVTVKFPNTSNVKYYTSGDQFVSELERAKEYDRAEDALNVRAHLQAQPNRWSQLVPNGKFNRRVRVSVPAVYDVVAV